MKNLFNEDDFNSLFESKDAVIDSEGKGPKGNVKTPDVGATKGMQSDFDSIFADLFSDAEMGDDQSAPVQKQPDTGAAGGSVDPEGDDKGNVPVKSEWDALFETGETDTDDEKVTPPADDDKDPEPPKGENLEKKKCHKGSKKLKSDFEALFEDDDDDGDDETAGVDPEAGTDPVPPVEGEDKKTDDDSLADEFVELLSEIEDMEITGF